MSIRNDLIASDDLIYELANQSLAMEHEVPIMALLVRPDGSTDWYERTNRSEYTVTADGIRLKELLTVGVGMGYRCECDACRAGIEPHPDTDEIENRVSQIHGALEEYDAIEANGPTHKYFEDETSGECEA